MSSAQFPVAAVVRPRLLASAAAAHGRPCLICGPHGSGKTWLAEHITDGSSADLVCWLDCSDGWTSTTLERLRQAAREPGKTVLVVVDGVAASDASTVVAEACQIASQCPGLRLVLTSIWDPGDPGTVHKVGALDLRFTPAEVRQLAETVRNDVSDEDVYELIRATGGHAGLLSAALGEWGAGRTAGDAACHAVTSTAVGYTRMLVEDAGSAIPLVCALLGEADVACALRLSPGADLASFATAQRVVPLIACTHITPRACFSTHPALLQFFAVRGLQCGDEQIVARTLEELVECGRVSRVLEILEVMALSIDVASWLPRIGRTALDLGYADLVAALCRSVEPAQLLCAPEILLIHARALRDLGDALGAQRKADAARRVAESMGAVDVEIGATLLDARLLMDLSHFHMASRVLIRATERLPVEESADVEALVFGNLSGCLAMLGDREGANTAAARAMRAAGRGRLKPEVELRVLICSAAIEGYVEGRWDNVVTLCTRLGARADLPEPIRAWTNSNLAAALAETGRLTRALRIMAAAESGPSAGSGGLAEAFLLDTIGVLRAGDGSREAAELFDRAASVFREVGDQADLVLCLLHRAAACRTQDQSMIDYSEQAFELSGPTGQPALESLAVAEVAADLLVLGSTEKSRTQAQSAWMIGERHAGSYHTLRADMILAEIDRREGRLGEAVERLAEHRAYILTESSNWQIAMYCRAFPGLLGLFVKALGGADQFPSHLLRMIPAETAEVALGASRELLSSDEWASLGSRLLGAEEFARWRARDGRPLCRVRLFGGLDVSVGGTRVADGEWRKRKARLLFAMLAVRRGQDVTRDQLQEYLWPDMDETRSRNNLYVTWNAMKSVLMHGETRGECAYVTNAGGRCRIDTDNVWTDLDEFESALAAARQAEAAGQPVKAVEAYSRAADVYRGDLLPGDLYDEWFAATRDHYRGEYCDAMYRAAELLVDRDPGSAVVFARRGLSADAFREDLYQAALRGQIASGQRGAAVDTYFQCRTKLSDELGLDPSPETQALYERVLGMEDNPRLYLAEERFDE